MNLPKYKKHKDHDERLKSAYLAVKVLLETDLYLSHKKELLSICIWKITEVDGKYTTRYMSEGAITENNKKNLNHEHVVERQFIINELLNNPSDYETILSKAIGCTVTKDEHKELTFITKQNVGIQGWDRYKFINLKVFDLSKQEQLKV